MSRWHGKQYRGAMRDLRKTKRREAEERNARTPHERTRTHRLMKCEHGHVS